MAVVSGAPTHRLLVKLYDGEQRRAGDLVAYLGEPNWKFEPLDPKSREEWAKSVAQPERVEHENWRTGDALAKFG